MDILKQIREIHKLIKEAERLNDELDKESGVLFLGINSYEYQLYRGINKVAELANAEMIDANHSKEYPLQREITFDDISLIQLSDRDGSFDSVKP